MITPKEFSEYREALLNRQGCVFGLMPAQIQELLRNIPAVNRQAYRGTDNKSSWSTDNENLIRSYSSVAYRVDPEWAGPQVEQLPETDGVLQNPMTLRALQNPKRIPVLYAPESWKRDFRAAVKLGARWSRTTFPQLSSACCLPGGWAEDDAYWIDPDWSMTPERLPETDGDFQNPETLRALQNPKRLTIDRAPGSWKRDFRAAVALGACWSLEHSEFSSAYVCPSFGGGVCVYCLDPQWSTSERLPETNGDLRDPITLRALQNPKRIKAKYAPESWKRDFRAAYDAGATWTWDDMGWIKKGDIHVPNLNSHQAYQLHPDWRMPELNTILPETDGDLGNPETIRALQNSKRLTLDRAPESWKRDFKAAVKAGARWLCIADSSSPIGWLTNIPELDMPGRPYWIDPGWRAPKFVDLVPELIRNHWRVNPPSGSNWALMGITVHRNFAGFVYENGKDEVITYHLKFDYPDGCPKLQVPKAVRFRTN